MLTCLLKDSPCEASGHFVGFADNVGNALTFKILTDDTNKIIHCSAVRSAEDPTSINLCSDNGGDDTEQSTTSADIIKSRSNGTNKPPMALIEIEEIMGKPLRIVMDDQSTQEITIVDAIKEHENNAINSPQHTKFKVSRGKDKCYQ